MKPRKLIIPGGSGFLGRVLSDWFTDRGWEVVVLARKPGLQPSARVISWDGRTLGSWADELEGANAVVNLAGRSVDCRYNSRNRQEIMDRGSTLPTCLARRLPVVNSRHRFG